MKKLTAGILFLFAVLSFTLNTGKYPELPDEPADPDTYDLSVWEKVKPDIHSGFGSIDSSWSKSIPPVGNVAETIKLQGWKGERVNCQLLVWSKGLTEIISIKASELNCENGRIDKNDISLSVVRYV